MAKDSLHPFVVETEKMDVTVLGTQFNVNTYRVDGCYETTLVEGKVEVCDRLSKKEVVLLPDEQARLQGGNLSVRKVDTRLYTSWVNGRFYFEREALEEIAAQLGINERSSASQLARAKASLAEQVRAWMKTNR